MTQTIKTKIINRHGLRIAVKVEIPKHSRGIMMIMHGWTSSMDGSDAPILRDVAIENRLTAVRFDCTHSSGQSDGSVEHSTISTFISDFEDVFSWCETQDWFTSPVLLAGVSLGSAAILDFTRRNPDKVFAIAPACTIISGRLSLEAHQRTEESTAKIAEWKDTGFQSREINGHIRHLPWSHMEDRMKYDALQYAPTLTMPLFMCVGSKDESCPPDHQHMLFSRWGGGEEGISHY